VDKKPEHRDLPELQNRLLLLNKGADIVEGKVKRGRRLSQGKISQITSSCAGFTLLEVLISMVILSIALLGLAALATTTIRSNTFSNDYTTATSIAQNQLESLINLNFGALDAQNGVNGTSGKHTWTNSVTGAGSTRTIGVTVSWTSAYGNAKNVVLTSIKSNT